jgi:hypothetical protein
MASNLPTLAISAMLGVTIGISRLSQQDMPRDFALYATAGIFYHDQASNLLTYHAVTAAICQMVAYTIARIANTCQ